MQVRRDEVGVALDGFRWEFAVRFPQRLEKLLFGIVGPLRGRFPSRRKSFLRLCGRLDPLLRTLTNGIRDCGTAFAGRLARRRRLGTRFRS